MSPRIQIKNFSSGMFSRAHKAESQQFLIRNIINFHVIPKGYELFSNHS